METKISINHLVTSVIGALVLFLVIGAGIYNDGAGVIEQIWSTTSHFVGALIGLAAVLGLLHFSQRVRETSLFDKYGPAGEMKKIQNRVGTEVEGPNDAISVAIRHAGTSVMIGLFFLAYFVAN